MSSAAQTGIIIWGERHWLTVWGFLLDSQLRGVSRMESLEIVLGGHSADYSKEQKEALATEKNEIYKSYLSSMTPGDLSGEQLHHCVGSSERYWDRIERQESYVLFLRRTSEPDKPYYTLEVEPDDV